MSKVRFANYRSYTVKAQLPQKVKTKLPNLINRAQKNGASVLKKKKKKSLLHYPSLEGKELLLFQLKTEEH